jgi:hypothetical protein
VPEIGGRDPLQPTAEDDVVPTSHAHQSKPSFRHQRLWSPCVGAFFGAILALLFSVSRLGPRAFLWFEGKGGETILTPLGNIVRAIVFVTGAFTGSFCERAIHLWYGRWIATAKQRYEAGQDPLWDTELDG